MNTQAVTFSPRALPEDGELRYPSRDGRFYAVADRLLHWGRPIKTVGYYVHERAAGRAPAAAIDDGAVAFGRTLKRAGREASRYLERS